MTTKPMEKIKLEKREFIFRAWNESKEYMYDNIAVGVLGKILYLRGTPKKKGADWYVGEDFEDGITIMQFTGIKDGKNRKVFEGDVVKVGAQEKLAVVYWSQEMVRFELSFVDEKKVIDFSDKRSLRQFRVVGNIYENPELVGGEPRTNVKSLDYDLEISDEEDFEE